jgi:predicted RNA-binding protein with PUA-like domain
MVDITAEHRFPTPVPLERLKAMPKLAKMVLLQKGSRLSVQPVTEFELNAKVALGEQPS